VLVYDPPARQAFFAVANPSGVPLIGIGPDLSGGWGVAVYEPNPPFGDLRAGMGKDGVSGEWRMGVGSLADQNGVLLSWKTTGTANEPRIVVANGSLATPVFLVDREGDVTVRGTTVSLPNIPNSSTATEVLVWNSSGSKVERRSAEGLAWLLTGNSITGTEFLGTTNNQPLVIQVNSTQTFQFNTNLSLQRDAGGSTRGQHAVDLQSARAAAAQVASGDYSVIGGGQNNTASGLAATVGGGQENTASGIAATVGGGSLNTASGDLATVGGGRKTPPAAILPPLAGAGPTPPAASEHRQRRSATVGGGQENTASGIAATVGGGYLNTASGDLATVGGGWTNTASGLAATVGGGEGNEASGQYATVGGGQENTASGNYSVVPGGYSNTANGAYNLVFGEDVDPSVTETHRVYFFSPANPGFLVINRLDGDHPIHVGTTLGAGDGDGAHLTAGGVWTNASSRSFKERFVQYRPAEVLERIRQLPVQGYFYKGTEEYHITPMAEDFYRLFGTGVREIIETDSTGQLVRRPNPDVDKYLAASDVAGVALLGVKALDERISTLDPQSTAWALTGNSGTNPTVNFLGTTDAQPLVIRTDNTERMRITATGDVGIGTSTPAATLDVNGTVAFSATATLTNTGSALTLPSNVAVVEIVDGGGAGNINVNPPTTGTQGQLLFIRYSGSKNLTLVGVQPGGGNQTATAQFHAILMYIGGGWRLMSFVD
jgi:hypothetical protein